MSQIIQNLGGLIGIGNIPLVSTESIFYLKNYASIFIIGFIAATPVVKNICIKLKEKAPKLINMLEPVVLTVLLVVCVSFLVDGSFNPFLYFRF